jgi:CPA1 family monovalent cation:H+ antiporter
MQRFLRTEAVAIELLLVASLVAIPVRHLRIPYTLSLVIVGLLLTFQQPVETSLAPALVLALLVPTLVVEAVVHLNLAHRQRDLASLRTLAVPGVLLTTTIMGGRLAWLVPLSFPWRPSPAH